MANYECVSRTNYFRVKDEAAFRKWAEDLELKLVEQDGKFALFPGDWADDGSFPSQIQTEDGEWDDIDIVDEICRHVAPGSVAIVMSVGWEKLRYLTGYAVAVRSDGEVKTVNLDDIYKAVAGWGETTKAEY